MKMIICKDIFGKEYEIPEEQLIPRTSAYGVVIKDNSVLLVRDKIREWWEFPGGGVEENETEIQAMQREVEEETGLTPTEDAELIETLNENFYSHYSHEAYDSTRKFYLVRELKGGSLLENGNGWDTVQAKFALFDEVEAFGEKEMKQTYKDVLKKATALTSVNSA